MKIYRLFDRAVMLIALSASIAFLRVEAYEAACAAIALWPISRALISVLDVFFTFFTERPLIRASAPAQAVKAAQF